MSVFQQPAPNAGLYIHIPFCKRKCCYCHFYSTCDIDLLPVFIHALLYEISREHSAFDEFDTIYFGGGTPSLLDAQTVETILGGIYNSCRISFLPEITIEINPADRDFLWLRDLRRLGVNRLSVGIQSFNDEDLAFLGRRHTSAEAMAILEMATMADFENTGFDLIYGLPDQTLTSWEKTLETAVSYLPAHLSCYELTLETGTPLAARYAKDQYPLSDEERQSEFFHFTSDYLQRVGYMHYEVSNFARGEEVFSRHNQKYWNRTPYLGLGPSAHSYCRGKRWWNHASLDRYLSAIRDGRTPLAGAETLTPDQMRLEDLFLGLRTRKGLDFQTFKYRYGLDLLLDRESMMAELVREGYLALDQQGVRPTRKGFAVADRLAVMLYEG